MTNSNQKDLNLKKDPAQNKCPKTDGFSCTKMSFQWRNKEVNVKNSKQFLNRLIPHLEYMFVLLKSVSCSQFGFLQEFKFKRKQSPS